MTAPRYDVAKNGSWPSYARHANHRKNLVKFFLYVLHDFLSSFLGKNRSRFVTTFHCNKNMSSGILPSFLGAVQASLDVLLTISYGVIASRLSILKESSSRDISKMCVRLFLPALLITNVGEQLHADTAGRYVPVLSKPFCATLGSETVAI